MANNSKHTPGPWIIRHNADGTVYEGGDKPYTIASHEGFLIAIGAQQFQESTAANAALIAAAPELLEAAKKAQETLVSVKEFLHSLGAAYGMGATFEALENAITKAEGK